MQKNAVDRELKSVSEMQAAQMMWQYYKDNKALLASDISEYRDLILNKLMLGHSVIEVFAPFMRSAEMSVDSKKTSKQNKTEQNAKHQRPAWPFTTT